MGLTGQMVRASIGQDVRFLTCGPKNPLTKYDKLHVPTLLAAGCATKAREGVHVLTSRHDG